MEQIKTNRLILRPFGGADIPRVADILGNYEVSQWLSTVPHPFTEKDVRVFNENGTSRWPDLMAIEFDERMIGAIGIAPQLGYYLDPECHGLGLMSEAAQAVCRNFFENSTKDEIRSNYFSGNNASRRVLVKCGFREISRSYAFSKARGAEVASVGALLTRENWEAIQ